MEKYAYNLETVVKERTNQLLEEKKKTENLLLRMLPKYVQVHYLFFKLFSFYVSIQVIFHGEKQ